MSRILVTDDEDQIRAMLRHALESSGHEVLEANNGEEGVRIYQKQPADLVITDILMPEKEGLESIRELRRLNPAVRIIAISGGPPFLHDGCARRGTAFRRAAHVLETVRARKSPSGDP